jgi:uncharacterized protein
MPAELASKLRQWGAAGRPERKTARPRVTIEAVLPGRFEPTAHGPCFVVEQSYPLDMRQGTAPLARALGLSPRARHLLTRGLATEALDPRQALFLDTETTGLAGGTGTYAFLVGVAYFEGDSLQLRQYFMRHPGEESALLAALGDLLAAFPLWVTFNGKTFDVPLLETRYLLTRRERLAPPHHHLDLLHPARRLWRSRLPSCALGSLERVLLGVRRVEDVPAWTIPGIYFDYVRDGKCEPLRGVFAHNAEDLLSLVALLGLVGDVLDEPPRHAHHADATALLRLYAQAGLASEAAAWCPGALPHVPPAERGALRWELALLLRRAGHRERAVGVWQELAREPGPWAAAAQIELAKHYEHHARDYAAATRATEAALAALAVSRLPVSDRERLALERRLGRLYFRARRAQAAPAGCYSADAETPTRLVSRA